MTNLADNCETGYITLVTEVGPKPDRDLTNVDDLLAIDWDSIEEFLCDEEDDNVSAVTDVKKHFR